MGKKTIAIGMLFSFIGLMAALYSLGSHYQQYKQLEAQIGTPSTDHKAACQNYKSDIISLNDSVNAFEDDGTNYKANQIKTVHHDVDDYNNRCGDVTGKLIP